MNADVSGRLEALARRQPGNAAVLCGERRITFGELNELCWRQARGLARAGIRPDDRVALMVPPGIEFVSLTFALFRAGAVVVLIDPGMGRENIRRCLAEAAPAAFIGSSKAHVARLLEGWGKDSVRTLITAGRRWGWGGLGLGEVEALGKEPAGPVDVGPTAAVLFTSGSTGAPKGAVYTHDIFDSQARLLAERFSIAPGGVSVPTFPLFALFDVALGLTAVIPRMDATRPGFVDPMAVIEPIQRHGAVQLFGSPALLDRVGRFGERHGILLPSLRRVLSAGAPVPASVLARFAKLLPPEARVFTPYGATEALPVSVIDSAEILGETAALSAQGRGVCVGLTFSGMEARIIKISDEPVASWSDALLVPDGEIGEIVVRGPVVTRGYFRRPQATALSKIAGGDGVWHRMGDLGYRDSRGRLWFCGRKSHRVTTAQGPLFTIPCEGVFNAHRLVRRTALVGVGPAGEQEPVLCVELEDRRLPRDESLLKEELLALGGAFPQTKGVRTILFHPSFPVDTRHNAKIFREKLAVWAQERLR
jgi:acyl-CoA synthetase (AMP-forming)/AMP-acid ligase II